MRIILALNKLFLVVVFCSAIFSCSKSNNYDEKIADFYKNTPKEKYECKDCNVIFISMTNLRADHLGLYGYKRATSPNLDKFFKDAFVFENAFSVASWTLPVAMSIYTSTYPLEHKVIVRNKYSPKTSQERNFVSLPDNVLTFVDILHDMDYYSASINSAKDYLPFHGLTNRFNLNHSSKHDMFSRWGQYGSINQVGPEAIRWLEDNYKSKFFLHIQSYDTHCPFAYPKENDKFDPDYKGDIDFTYCYWSFDRVKPITIMKNGVEEKCYNLKTSEALPNNKFSEVSAISNLHKRLNERDIEHMIALYDGEIFESDNKIGDILNKIKELNLLDNTIIVFFSEHGDMFGKHGRFMRGGALRGSFYDDVLHIPLFIYHPKLKGKKVDKLVSLIDLAPTILEFLDIEKPEEFKGKSLVPVLFGEQIRSEVYASTAFIPHPNTSLFTDETFIASVRNKDFKLIREKIYHKEGTADVEYELFNIKKDAEELNNVADKYPKKLKELDAILENWIRSMF